MLHTNEDNSAFAKTLHSFWEQQARKYADAWEFAMNLTNVFSSFEKTEGPSLQNQFEANKKKNFERKKGGMHNCIKWEKHTRSLCFSNAFKALKFNSAQQRNGSPSLKLKVNHFSYFSAAYLDYNGKVTHYRQFNLFLYKTRVSVLTIGWGSPRLQPTVHSQLESLFSLIPWHKDTRTKLQ